MTMTWAIVTGLHFGSHCWFGYNHTSYYWIVEGPRLALIAVICHVIRWRSKPSHFSSQRLENFLFFPGQLVVLTEYSTGPFNQVAKQQLEWNQESQVCPWCTLGRNRGLDLPRYPDNKVELAILFLYSPNTCFARSAFGLPRSVLGK